MLTEAEARTKWCPFTRLTTGLSTGFNRVAPPGIDTAPMISAACCCIASACMAWRWAPLMADAAYVEAVRKAAEELSDKSPSRAQAAKHVNANRAKYGLPDKPFAGYCGLAGKPEPA